METRIPMDIVGAPAMDNSNIELVNTNRDAWDTRISDEIRANGRFVGQVFYRSVTDHGDLVDLIFPITNEWVTGPENFLKVHVRHDDMLDVIKAIVSLLPPL